MNALKISIVASKNTYITALDRYGGTEATILVTLTELVSIYEEGHEVYIHTESKEVIPVDQALIDFLLGINGEGGGAIEDGIIFPYKILGELFVAGKVYIGGTITDDDDGNVLVTKDYIRNYVAGLTGDIDLSEVYAYIDGLVDALDIRVTANTENIQLLDEALYNYKLAVDSRFNAINYSITQLNLNINNHINSNTAHGIHIIDQRLTVVETNLTQHINDFDNPHQTPTGSGGSVDIDCEVYTHYSSDNHVGVYEFGEGENVIKFPKNRYRTYGPDGDIIIDSVGDHFLLEYSLKRNNIIRSGTLFSNVVDYTDYNLETEDAYIDLIDINNGSSTYNGEVTFKLRLSLVPISDINLYPHIGNPIMHDSGRFVAEDVVAICEEDGYSFEGAIRSAYIKNDQESGEDVVYRNRYVGLVSDHELGLRVQILPDDIINQMGVYEVIVYMDMYDDYTEMDYKFLLILHYQHLRDAFEIDIGDRWVYNPNIYNSGVEIIGEAPFWLVEHSLPGMFEYGYDRFIQMYGVTVNDAQITTRNITDINRAISILDIDPNTQLSEDLLVDSFSISPTQKFNRFIYEYTTTTNDPMPSANIGVIDVTFNKETKEFTYYNIKKSVVGEDGNDFEIIYNPVTDRLEVRARNVIPNSVFMMTRRTTDPKMITLKGLISCDGAGGIENSGYYVSDDAYGSNIIWTSDKISRFFYDNATPLIQEALNNAILDAGGIVDNGGGTQPSLTTASGYIPNSGAADSYVVNRFIFATETFFDVTSSLSEYNLKVKDSVGMESNTHGLTISGWVGHYAVNQVSVVELATFSQNIYLDMLYEDTYLSASLSNLDFGYVIGGRKHNGPDGEATKVQRFDFYTLTESSQLSVLEIAYLNSTGSSYDPPWLGYSYSRTYGFNNDITGYMVGDTATDPAYGYTDKFIMKYDFSTDTLYTHTDTLINIAEGILTVNFAQDHDAATLFGRDSYDNSVNIEEFDFNTDTVYGVGETLITTQNTHSETHSKECGYVFDIGIGFSVNKYDFVSGVISEINDNLKNHSIDNLGDKLSTFQSGGIY